jgi:hypothetical protein
MKALNFVTTLAVVAAVSSVASAQISAWDGSGATDTEGFDYQLTPNAFPNCVEDRVFHDQADLCAVGPTGFAHITGGWGFGCSIGPNLTPRLFGGSEHVVYTFDEEVSHFGGYFGTNNPSASGANVIMRDANGNIIFQDNTLVVPNDCTWNWHGWKVDSGPNVKSIELWSNYSSGGYLDMDDMAAIIVPAGGGPGAAYCVGDGTGTGCPCGNNSTGPGGCDWGNASFPEGGILDATGSNSIATNNAYLVATGVENNFGVFFGANDAVNGGMGNVFGDGLRCAGGGLIRLTSPTIAAGNQATLPQTISDLDGAAAPGVTRRYQYWFRTPNGPCGTIFNLSNGYEITWM